MMKRFFLFLFFTSLVFIACSDEKEKKEEISQEESVKIQRKLSFLLDNDKAFKLEFISQEKVKFSRDKPVLFMLFTSWCLPCAAQIPVLNQIKKEFDQLDIIGLLLEENLNKKSLIKEKNIHFSISNSKDIQGFASNLGVQDLPALLLYEKDGTLYRFFTGLMPLEMLRTALINMKN